MNTNYVRYHSYDEGSDGLHAWSCLKPAAVPSLCEEAGLDITISTADAAQAYNKICSAYLAGKIDHSTLKTETALVHKKRGPYHA